jgi:hypothetical protein
LLLVHPAEQLEESPFSATVWQGTPPSSSGGGGGNVTPPLLRSIAVSTAMLLLDGRGSFSSGREPHVLHLHRKSQLCRHLSVAACTPYSIGGMDLRCGGDVIHVRLCPQLVAAQNGASTIPWRSGYIDMSIPYPFQEWGWFLKPTCLALASQTFLFLLLLHQCGRPSSPGW